MDPFFSCRKASKGCPLQTAASGSPVGTGPGEVVLNTGEAAVVASMMLNFRGAVVVASVVVGTISVTSSTSSKVSPRAADGQKRG